MEEFIAADEDNVCTDPTMEDKDILEFVQSSKDMDADLDDENEMNNEAPVPTSSEMRNIVESAIETSRNIAARVIERDTSGEIYYFLEDSRGLRTRQHGRQ
ncbi:hypothetical protein TNCV_4717211 [Trichonephila clavipes]|nr:hypothetical protein TNCV_4717211 [Trichonephila clavipes]